MAPSWEALVAARVLQGAGAAVIVPVSLALILPEYPVERRAAAVGTWGAAAALAAASGPPLGGLLVEVADWRWVFLVNLPLGLLVFAMGRRSIVESVDEDATGLPDLAGSRAGHRRARPARAGDRGGGELGLDRRRASLGAASPRCVLLVLTARRCLTHPRPIVDPALMRIPSFRGANLGTLLLGMAFFSTILGNILFLTSIWDYGILTAGLAVVPGAIASAVVAGPGRAPRRPLRPPRGDRARLPALRGRHPRRGAAPARSPTSSGRGCRRCSSTAPASAWRSRRSAAAALTDIPPARFASATAVSAAFRQFGGVLGTAGLFAVVGAPATLAAALDAAQRAYLLSAVWALAAALAALSLRPAQGIRPV